MKAEYNSNSVVAIRIIESKKSERFKKFKSGNIFTRNRIEEWYYSEPWETEWTYINDAKIPSEYILQDNKWMIKPNVMVFLSDNSCVYHYCDSIEDCKKKAMEIKEICGTGFIRLN
ncbi:MAG: hypothetical protein GY928_14670 [Colwellia sp.]|nr:hypothetical protein [Colwellia sp.]